MSRLRRPFLYDRYIFVTVKLLPSRAKLEARGYERLATSVTRMRRKHGFAITAWVFLPDHSHAIIYPRYPLTISTVFKAREGNLDDGHRRAAGGRAENSARTGFPTARCVR